MKREGVFFEYLMILLGSALYAASTVCFIFPQSLLLGGTSGVSVILTSFLSGSPGVILTVINGILLLLALLILGKSMALKTFMGSALTTVFISALEALLDLQAPPIANPFLSAGIGAAVIALASGVMFYVDSSSGGTDIIALIIKKFSRIHIGKALLITDIVIVVAGGILSGWMIAASSFMGLLIKTLGIDAVIKMIKRIQEKYNGKEQEEAK
ncbi:MAG: YitT family protein [Clostridia bacterium]|nr:YitT family protein [Clostridia bacterium]MBQ8716778.1 YitT family protein [Clostridia bacterium]